MPNYFGQSAWQDAGRYGQGLGSTLADALLQMPMQRAELQARGQQVQMQQQFEMQRLQQQQAAAQSENQLGQAELSLHQQEAQHNQEVHQATLATMQAKQKLAERGTYKPYKDPDTGAISLYNTMTGETKPFSPQPQTRGLPNAVQDNLVNNLTRLTQGFGAGAFSGNGTPDQQGYMWNQYTNAVPQLQGLIQHGLQALTNRPAGLPQGAPPPTNALPQQSAPQQKVLRFNPQTGALE